MKFFVTGVCGQLGHDLMDEVKSRGLEAIGTDIADVGVYCLQNSLEKEEGEKEYISLDITDPEATAKTMERVKPDILLHCAAWTAVDAAEDEENRAVVHAVNVTGTKNLAEHCAKLGIPMVYISTDYIFDGLGQEPWDPACERFAPCNYYGKTKLEGEMIVKDLLENFFIVRIAWVFGRNGNNFIRTMLKLAENHDQLKVVCDQIGTPTYTFDLARLLVDMALTDRFGIYHATNEGGYISWYEYAKEIFRQAAEKNVPAASGSGKPVAYDALRVEPVTTEEYGASKARRPLNSRMEKKKLSENGFIPLPVWQDALSRYLDEYSDDLRQAAKERETDSYGR